MKKNELKKTEGITLIALVVTIIVLIILAGVSISMLSGQNGILNRAIEAKDAMETAQKEDLAVLADLETIIDNNGESIFDENKGVNKPKITEGMIPVKYDSSQNNGSWVICSENDSEWYSYKTGDKNWANVMLSDGKYSSTTLKEGQTKAEVGKTVSKEEVGSMFVWIPRYAYKITSGYHPKAVTTGTIDVKFLVGTTSKTIDNEKIVEYNGQTTNNYTKFPEGYVVHPAFTNKVEAGGWEKEITGIWVAKFEAGYPMENTVDNASTVKLSNNQNLQYPVFKGQRYSYNNINIENCYLISQSLEKTGNPYGLTTVSNSHLIKNSEWGAVVYLAKSDYGKNSEVYINNVSLENATIGTRNTIYAITGYAGTSAGEGTNTGNKDTVIGDTITGTNSKTSYAWYYKDSTDANKKGMNASTTGTEYGIYDMSGGCWDYTSGVIPTGHGSITSYGGNTFKNMTQSSKYATLYPIGGSTQAETDISRSYPSWGKMYGDAMWETSKGVGADNPNSSWFGDRSDEDAYPSEPFFVPGGGWTSGGTAGTFAFADYGGSAYDY